MKTKTLLLLLICALIHAALFAAETEPNNARSSANTLALNGSNSGKINPAGDQDWWKITTTKDGRLDVKLTSVDGQYIWVNIYDNDGTTKLAGQNTNSNTTVSADGLAVGTYYLQIVGYYSTTKGSYTISNTLVTPAQNNDKEPNDTKGKALNLPLNGSVKGHIGYYYKNLRDTFDWYKIIVPEDGLLRIRITSNNSQYVYAYLYDNDGSTQLAASYANTTTDINKDGLAAGTYYVMIKAYYGNGFIPYTLSDSLFKPKQANDNEPNDSKSQAVTFNANSTKTGHINYYYNSESDVADWYKITINDDGMVGLTLTSNNGQYVWAYLYDNDGTTQLGAQYTNSTMSYNTDGLQAGTYYVKVSAYYSNGFAPYTLQNTFSKYNFVKESEPDDKAYQAKTIPANETVEGHVGFYYKGSRDAIDWWKVNYTGNGSLSFTFNLENRKKYAGPDYTWFYVYKDTTKSPIYSQYFIANSSTINLTNLKAGYYYVKINTYYSSSLNSFSSYSIKTSFVQKKKASIVLVSANTVNDGTCPTTNEITFKCSGSKAPYSVQLYRFNKPYGKPVIVKNTKNFTISNLPNGYYYAAVYGDGATGDAFGKSAYTEVIATPKNLSTTNKKSTSAKLNWAGINCASYYTVQYRKVGDANWTIKNTKGNVNSLSVTGLKAATNYEWKVAAADTANGTGGTGLYSAVAKFTTTGSALQASDEPLITNSIKTPAVETLNIYPNPAKESVIIDYQGKGKIISLRITDMTGRTVLNKNKTTLNNLQHRLDVSSLGAGSYIVTLYTANNQIVTGELIIVK